MASTYKTVNPGIETIGGWYLHSQVPTCKCTNGIGGAYTRRGSARIEEMRTRDGRKTKRSRCPNGNAWHLTRSRKEEANMWEKLGGADV